MIAALLLAATAASMQAGQAGQTGAPGSALWTDASRLIAEYSGDGLLSKEFDPLCLPRYGLTRRSALIEVALLLSLRLR